MKKARGLSWILGICLALPAGVASSQRIGGQRTGGMTREEFDRLPPGSLLDLGTRKITKAELLSALRRGGSAGR